MKTLVTEIPDTKHELVEWLEPIIVSSDLRQLVSELAVISTHGKPADLNTLLGGKLSEALDGGLTHVAETDLQSLFRHPYSLLQLQKQILESGGDYWLKLINSENQFENDEQTRAYLANLIEAPKIKTNNLRKTDKHSTKQNNNTSISRNKFLAMAAGVLIAATAGFLIYSNLSNRGGQQVAWGWSADESVVSLSQTEYLNKLARGADAWFNKRPSTKQDIQNRIREFKIGCEQMIAAEHGSLDAETSTWLVARLKTCLEGVNAQLTSIQTSTTDPIKIRSNVDQIVRDIAGDLRAQAG